MWRCRLPSPQPLTKPLSPAQSASRSRTARGLQSPGLSLTTADQHRDVHSERGTGVRDDLHGDRQRGQEHGGDPMSGSTSWSFTTDALQPAVSSHTPASGATGVAVSSAVTATFNEAVQSGTISFTLATSAGTSVAGALSYNSSTNTETFTPSAALAYGTTYTATVSGAKDTAGDPMSGSTSWSFTTEPLQPAVSSHTPASGATGVAVSTAPSANVQRGRAIEHDQRSHSPTARGRPSQGLSRTAATTNTETFTPSSALAMGRPIQQPSVGPRTRPAIR